MKVYFVYEGEPSVDDGNIQSERLNREEYKVKITLPAKWITGPCSKLLTFFVDTYNKKFADKPLDAEDLTLQCRGVTLPSDAEVGKYVEEYNDVLIKHKKKAVSTKLPEGHLMCTNFGCGKSFNPEENGPEACRHHAKGPVFHDLAKYWGCCPEGKANDWEEFEALPTCCVGPHGTENAPVSFTRPETQQVTAQALSEDQAKAIQGGGSTATEYVDAGKKTRGPREFEGADGASGDVPGKIVDGKASCRNHGCQLEFAVEENHDKACTYHVGKPVFWDTYKYWSCCPDKKHADFDDFVKVPGCAVGAHKV